MDFVALKRLSKESPFEGERQAAIEKLKILNRKKENEIDLSKPIIYFNRIFRRYWGKWFHIIYDLDKHGIAEFKFLYQGLFRHGPKEFSFRTTRVKYLKDGKWQKFGIHQLSANNIIKIEINKVGIYNNMKEFLKLVGFSYTKKLP